MTKFNIQIEIEPETGNVVIHATTTLWEWLGRQTFPHQLKTPIIRYDNHAIKFTNRKSK